LSASLSAAQRRQIATFAASVVAGDTVVCVGGAGAGPLQVLRDLARMRASSVCKVLTTRVPGVITKVSIALSGEVQVLDATNQSALGNVESSANRDAAASPLPLRVSAADLQRRVLVVVRRGR
jgi:hypothetical protein